MPGASGAEAAAKPTARIAKATMKATMAPKKVKVEKKEAKEDPEAVHARY